MRESRPEVERVAAPRRWTRRRLLRAAGGGLLAACAGVAAVRSGGYPAPPRALTSFSPWSFLVMQHMARRIAAPDRPGVVGVDDVGAVEFVDAHMAQAPASVRRQLIGFLGFVEQVAPLAAGKLARFTRLSPADQDEVLASLEASHNDLLRAGFDGVKCLVFMGYYRDPRTWSIAGYDGPLVGRPGGGWR